VNSRRAIRVLSALSAVWLVIYSCQKPRDIERVEKDPAYYAGGINTAFESGPSAYSVLTPVLSAAASADHFAGDAIFHATFDESDGIFGGLGPLFIQRSCENCHQFNGRSHPPFDKGDNSSGFLLRLSVAGESSTGGPLGVTDFGTQLQTEATAGNEVEGRFLITWENVVMNYPDGSSVTLRQPYYTIYNNYQSLPNDLLRSGRNASALIGLGLLEAIPDEDLLAVEDVGDADGDYISGIANRVWNPETGQLDVGRFGWKSGTATLIQQTADAFHQDMGITSEGLFPLEACAGQSNCNGANEVPDLNTEELRVTAFYLKSLAVPAPRNLEDPEVKRGKQIFNELNCTGCHVPQWQTGYSPYPFLSNQTIYPYSDLLIHDLGEGLGDGRPEFLASANDWRTAPLWGIGLAKIVNPEGTFLHDGRARTLEEAILWHGGEAVWSRNDFMNLPAEDRQALIAFLESL
jgi:CxxC motif-containing protein (DUF1111 family)